MKKDQDFQAFDSWNAFQATLKSPPAVPAVVPPPTCIGTIHFSQAKPGEVCPSCNVYLPQHGIVTQ